MEPLEKNGRSHARSAHHEIRDPLLNLRQLRYFAKVVETSSITRAAEQLCIAQPALSLNIKQLEEFLGVMLLYRHSRGVAPTPAGELLYSRTCSIFGVLEQTRIDVARFGQEQREYLTLGLSSSLVRLIGTEAIVNARDQLPSIAFSLREDPSFVLTDAVEAKEIDVAFAYAAIDRPGVQLTPVIMEKVLLVTRADQAPASEVVTLEQVLSYDIAHGGRRDVGRNSLEQAAKERGLSFSVTYEMRSVSGIRDIVLHGMAASVMPYGAVAREVESGKLAVRRIVEPDLESVMYVVRPTRSADAPAPISESLEVRQYLSGLIDLIVEKQGPLARRLSPAEAGHSAADVAALSLTPQTGTSREFPIPS